MFKQIMVPLDGSRFSSHALRYAIDIAKKFDAKLHLVRSVEPTMPVTSAVATLGVETASSAQVAVEAAVRQDRINTRRAERYMKKKQHELTSHDIKADFHVVAGHPYDAIMKFCRKEKIDLVVMTTHGKSGLKRAVLGSVADKVVRDPRVPVLVIRPVSRKRK